MHDGVSNLKQGLNCVKRSLVVFLGGFDNGMQFKECVSSEIRAERTRVLQLDFQFPYTPFTCVVVRWYHWVFEEIENVVPSFCQSLFQRVKLLAQLTDVLFQQTIQTFYP